MPDLTFEEFVLALAPSLGVPGKPSHELTVVAERVYDALVLAGLDIRAVVEGQPVLTRDEAALVVGAMPLQAFPVEPKPDLSTPEKLSAELDRLEAECRALGVVPFKERIALLRELAERWHGYSLSGAYPELRVAFGRCADDLTAALDAIEKGGA